MENFNQNLGKNLKQSIVPEIIVKFREGGNITLQKGRLQSTHLNLAKFYSTLDSFKEAKVRLSFPKNRKRLTEMLIQARRKLKRPIPSINLFVRIKINSKSDLVGLLNKLKEVPEIEYANLASIPGQPPQTPDFTTQQDYMDTPPDGVDAAYAWLYPGGNGNGVQICDCEYGFNQTHEDLPPVNVVSNRDGDLTQWEDHGTAVLGILVGLHDTKGINGICPAVTTLFASESGNNREDCINDAILALVPGDILVLEMQTSGGVPAERDSDIHAAITVATGTGIIVIAAAGNGNQNLDTEQNSQGLTIWDDSSPSWNDSGAIIVGAGHSNSDIVPHSKCGFSTYGDRVNCHGWGEDVVTTGYGTLYNGGPDATYRDTFGGTSSATPIVAGVAACLQGAAIQAFGVPLTATQMRNLLSDVTNGTPQADSATYPVASFHIGPMPDLRRILHSAGIQADVYMRDNVADTGVVPYSGSILCWSPDIIARKNIVANPDVSFGVTHWNEANLGENIEYGQDNFIYVRMYNRGNVSDDVSISVYWTDASGFIHPSNWNLIGNLVINNILPGEHRVADPLTWSQSQIPSEGHYCLIAVVNSNRDPITIPGAFTSSSDYMDFIRNHNNICYRNTEVEDILPGAPVPPYTFMLIGIPEKTGYHSIKIQRHLPKGAKIKVEIQKRIPKFERYLKMKKGNKEIRYLAHSTKFHIDDEKPLRIDKILLKKGEKAKANINIELPKNVPLGEYLLYADQYFEGKHLGRINYLLRVRSARKK